MEGERDRIGMGRQTWIAAVPGRPSVPAVIVTQPYARAETVVGKMERGLSLGNWLRPEIIAAPEWAFSVLDYSVRDLRPLTFGTNRLPYHGGCGPFSHAGKTCRIQRRPHRHAAQIRLDCEMKLPTPQPF